MSDLIAINAGAFNLAIQALKRAGKDEIAEQLESDCECVPDLIEQQQARISELGKREAELTATVERLRDAANQLSFDIAHDPSEPEFKSFGALQDVIAATPHQNLNAVKLGALLDFRHDCRSMNGYNAVDVWDKMDEYIKREFG